MANFPEIEPSSRRYDLGAFSTSVSTSFAAGGVRFLHGDESFGHDMILSFLDVDRPTAALIRDHYRLQCGSHVSFILFSITWQGNSDPEGIVPLGGRWKYVESPREIHKKGKLYGIEVTLRYVGSEATA